MDYYIFLVTVPNIEEGKKIARELVENKIAACVNLIQNIFSLYEWKGKVELDNEHLLLIKTTEENSEEIIQKVRNLHSYDEPECIGIKIEKGSESYLKWISDMVK